MLGVFVCIEFETNKKSLRSVDMDICIYTVHTLCIVYNNKLRRTFLFQQRTQQHIPTHTLTRTYTYTLPYLHLTYVYIRYDML